LDNIKYIEISGVQYSITCRDSIIIQEPDPAYASFLKPDRNAAMNTIDIVIDLHSLPSTEGVTKIFNTGQSWSMLKDNDYYFALLNHPSPGQKHVWMAKFDHLVNTATIYLGETFIGKKNGKVTVSNPLRYPLDQILLMYYLAQREGALIHAAGLEFNGKGYIFPGKSGAGKSTISRQLAGMDDYEFLSDDRMIVRKFNKTFKAFGTPWSGEAGIAVNKSVDLSGIFFISQASFNRIDDITPQKAMERLFPVVSIPWYDKEVMIKILDFCEDLISNMPVYELYFKPDIEVADVFKRFVSEK
jgi:hypothetical protein